MEVWSIAVCAIITLLVIWAAIDHMYNQKPLVDEDRCGVTYLSEYVKSLALCTGTFEKMECDIGTIRLITDPQVLSLVVPLYFKDQMYFIEDIVVETITSKDREIRMITCHLKESNVYIPLSVSTKSSMNMMFFVKKILQKE